MSGGRLIETYGDLSSTRGWRPPYLLQASALLHLVCFAVFYAYPESSRWLIAALSANHLIIIAAVFCPRSQLLGPAIVRLPQEAIARGEVALTFDDGPDPTLTPKVLALLERFGMKATFFCVGSKVTAHAALVREMVSRGHAVENHSHEHRHAFSALDPWRMARDIDEAQAALAEASGQTPRFFRAPNGFRNPWLDPLLVARGLRYAAWTRRGLDTLRRDPAVVLHALSRNLAAGDVLLLHDCGSTHTADGKPVVLVALTALLEQLRRAGLVSVTLRQAFATR